MKLTFIQRGAALLILTLYIVFMSLPARASNINVNVSVNTILTMDVDSTSLNMGSIAPGQPTTGSTQITVSTNSEHGYQLSAHHSSVGYTDTLRHTDGVTYLADKDNFDGTASTTAIWSGTGFGFTLFSATEKNTTIWGTGTEEESSANRYSGLPDSAIAIHSVSTNIANDITNIGYKADVSSAQKAGSYSGDVTFTATVIP